MDKLDNYTLTIDSKYAKEGVELGWDDTAYTDDPAILIIGVALNKNKQPKKRMVELKEKHSRMMLKCALQRL